MTPQPRALHRVLNVVLVVVAIALGAEVARRYIVRGGGAGDVALPPPREFVADWEDLLHVGQRIGAPGSVVEIVEFVDLECPACARSHSAIREVRLELGAKVGYVVVPFPLPQHLFATAAARAAECVRPTSLIEKFLDRAFETQDAFGAVSWWEIARRSGATDSVQFADCTADTAAARAVQAGVGAGLRFGVTSTPTTIINGWRYDGALPPAVLRRIVLNLARGRAPSPVIAAPAGDLPPTTRRSADGSVEVRHDGRALDRAPQFELADRPVTVAGGAGATPEFDVTYVYNAVLLQDGSIVASTSSSVLLFGLDGQPVRVLAKGGNGPGEVRNATVAAIGGDTLLLSDRAHRRLTWLLPRGGVVKEAQLDAPWATAAQVVAGVLPGGLPVLHSAGKVSDRRGATVERAEIPVYVLDPGPSPRAVARIPDVLTALIESRGTTRTGGPAPPDIVPVRFTPSASVAVWDTLIATASGDSYQIDLRDANGRVIRQIRVDVPRRLVTRAMVEAAVADELEAAFTGVERPENRPEYERVVRAAPVADSLPAIADLFVASDNTLWVLDVRAPRDSVWSATAFRPDGRILRRLQAKGRSIPLAFGSDRVLVREEDQNGLVTLRVHRFRERE